MTKKQIDESCLVQKMKLEAMSLLRQIQKLSGGEMIHVAGKAIEASDLAKILVKPFRGSVLLEFYIGDYHVSLVASIPGNQEFPTSSLAICLNKRVVIIKQVEIKYTRTPDMTCNFQDLQAIFAQLMSWLGAYDLYLDYDYPGKTRVNSLYLILLQDRTTKEKKQLPAWSSNFIIQARKLAALGDTNTLRKIIREELKRLQPVVIAEAMPLLRSDAHKLMAAAEATKLVLSPKIESEKIPI